MKRLFKSTVLNGELKFYKKPEWITLINSLEGKEVGIAIAPWTHFAQRTLLQNNYLHMLFQLIGDHTGESLEDAKYSVKRHLNFVDKVRHLDYNDMEFTDRITLRSTASLSKKEFQDFKLKIQKFGAEFLGIDLPDPNEII